MNKFCFLFVFSLSLIFHPNYFAQIGKKEKEKKVDSLLNLSNQAQLEVNIINIVKYANTALIESEKIKYSKGKASSCLLIASGLSDLGKDKDALKYITIGENEEFAKTNFILLAEFQRIRGRVYDQMGLHQASIGAFKKGIYFSKKIPDKGVQVHVQTSAIENLIETYKFAKKYDSMRFYLKKNELLLKSLDEETIYPNLVNFYSNYGVYYISQKKYDSAVHYFSKSKNMAAKHNFPYTSINDRELGNMAILKKQPDSALFYYLRALKNADETNLETEKIEINNLISSTYLEMGDTTRANKYKLTALDLAEKLNSQTKEAAEVVITQILQKEEKHFQEKNTLKTVLVSSVIILLIIGSIVYFITLKRNRKQIADKEKIIQNKSLETQELQEKVNDSFVELVHLAKDNNPEFFSLFSKTYPKFISKLLAIDPNLRSSELTFCAYLFLNFSTKDIAEYTYTSIRTVQNRKNSIRKKLNVSSKEDIYVWMENM